MTRFVDVVPCSRGVRPARGRALAVAVLLGAAALAGAGGAGAVSPPVGVVRGAVTFAGAPPAAATYPVSWAPEAAHCGAAVPDLRLRVDAATHGVRDTIVWLEPASGPAAPGMPPFEEPIELGYARCAPRAPVTLARLGSKARLVNPDPFLHNLRAVDVRSGDALFNYAIVTGAVHERVLDKPGLYALHCDVHVHEVAYLYVHQHAHVALTDASGRYEFTGVSAAAWTLRAWHADWRTVPAGSTKRPPKAAAAAPRPWEHTRPLTVGVGVVVTADLVLDPAKP